MERTGRVRVLYILFFCSGAAGLVYEVIWSRLFREVFGVTAYANATVLATYLGGLALGGWVLGRVADRRADPLRLYGLLEIGVGLTAVVGMLLVRLLDPVHIRAATRFAPDSATLACVRVALASLVILPPTFLMGGTLPVMTKVFVRRLGRLGRELSFLYGLNTSGAVAGTLLAGFLLIRTLGVHPTLWIAAFANLAVGAISLVLATRADTTPEAVGPTEAEVREAERTKHPVVDARGLLLMVGLSGVASLALEVIWARVLVLIVGSSTHAFVTMLAAFLVGIALGSFLTRLFIDRIADLRRAFGWVQAGVAASTLAAIPAIGALVWSAQRWLQEVEPRWVALALGRFGIAFLILLVPTTLIGMSFPLAGKIRVCGVQTLGSHLGQVYGANTIGNIAGAIAGGLVLLPVFGVQRGMVLLTTLNLAGAAWGLLPGGDERRRLRSVVRRAPALALFVVSAGMLVSWRPRPFVSIEEGEADRVLYYKEGLVSTVKVIQRADDARQLIMLVDGVRIGQSSGGIDSKQQVLAHFPFLLKPEGSLSRVLSIGLGTGILVGEVAKHPGVRSIECVELSPAVIEGARFFADYNGNVLDNPMARVIADDGMNFLRRSQAKYDAIISDGKSRLGQATNALFYSEDYFRSARQHLTDGGLLIQWMPLEEVAEDLRTIVRTFTMVFPHSYLWIGHGSCFLVGLQQPLVLDMPHIQRVIDAPETADLRRYGWGNASDVAALLVADSSSAKSWVSTGTTINSLEKPVLEFTSPRALATPGAVRVGENAAALARTRKEALNDVRLAGADSREIEASSRAVGHLLDALNLIGRRDPALLDAEVGALEKAIALAPDESAIRYSAGATLVSLGVEYDSRGLHDEAIRMYRAAIAAWPDNATARLNLASYLARQGATLEAVEHVRHVLRINPDSGAAHRLMGKILLEVNPAGAIAHLRQALRIAPDMAEVHNDLGRCLALSGRPHEALVELREAIRLRQDWAAPMAEAALLLATHPDPSARNSREAIRLATRASELTASSDPGVLEILAASHAAAGHFEEAVAAQRKALALAAASGDAKLAEEAASSLDLYQRRMPRR
jgi:spermidine synthase